MTGSLDAPGILPPPALRDNDGKARSLAPHDALTQQALAPCAARRGVSSIIHDT